MNMEIVGYLTKIPDAIVFENTDGELLLLFADKERAENGMTMLRKRFEEKWGKGSGAAYYKCNRK